MANLPLDGQQISISEINAIRGVANSNTSLKTSELAAMGDPSATGTANIAAAGALCMPEEIVNETTQALAQNTTGWVYTGPGQAAAWAPYRMGEFHNGYTGKPSVTVVTLTTGTINVCTVRITIGGRFAGTRDYYYALQKNGGAIGAWTTIVAPSITTSFNDGNGTYRAYVRDYLNCGSNYEFSSSSTYP
jgi:hypothetical protein